MNVPISRRAIIKIGLAAVALPVSSKYLFPAAGLPARASNSAESVRLAAFSTPMTTAAAMPRPTGPGIYALENLGFGNDLQAASNKVLTLAAAPDGSRTLTAPEGVFECNGFGNLDTHGFLIAKGVGLVGAGPGTILQVKPDSITAAQAARMPRRVITFPGSGNTTVAPVRIAQFTVQGTLQRLNGVGAALDYDGLIVQYAINPLLEDLLVKGIQGSLNSPPGETFGVAINSTSGAILRRVEVDGRNTAGVRVGAAGIATNSATNVRMYDCHSHHMCYSHGFAFWQTTGVTTYNSRSEYNGTGRADGGGGGTSGAGLNHEKTFNAVHYSPVLGFNSLTEIRYFAQDIAPNAGNTNGHQLHDVVISDGGDLNVKIELAQRNTAGEVNYFNCPAPVFEYYNCPAPAIPGAPATISVVKDDAARSVTLAWSPPVLDGYSTISGYRVSRDGTDASGNGPWVTTVGGTGRSQTFGNLRPGVSYTFSVQAINAKGTGSAVTATATIVAGIPAAPANPTASKNVAARTATITWLPPTSDGGSPVTGYRVSRDGTDAGGYGVWGTTVSGSTRSQTFTNLKPGTTYHLSAQATTAAGTGAAATVAVTMS